MQSTMESPCFFRSKRKLSEMASSAGEAEALHQIGFQVLRGAVEIDERVLECVKSTSAKKSGYIFNHNEVSKHNDHKRRQCNLPLKSKYMLKFDENIKQILKSVVNTVLTPTDPVILHSRPGCQPQAAHCDYLPNDALEAVCDEEMPLAALIALMPGTHLKIWPNSSRLAFMTPEQLKDIEPISCEEITLNPGDIIVFRGDFVHAGSAYEQDNYRIHYYLDSPHVPRKANRTWLIHQAGNEALGEIITVDAPVSKKAYS